MPRNRGLKDFTGPKSTIKLKVLLLIWFPVQHVIFKSTFLPPAVRPVLLKLFGATIGTRVFIRRGVKVHFPCSGGHDYRSASLEYAHKPLEIKDGAWVCLDAKVLPGVTIGECSVVSAGEVARKSVPDYSMLVGGEIRPIDPPK